MEFLQQIITLVQNNQTLLTIFGLGGAGTIILWLKGIPIAIFNFLKREFTTELVVTNYNIVFYDILRLIEKLYDGKNPRQLKLTNGRYGTGDDSLLSIGYGTHWLWYKNNFMLITMTKDASNQADRDKDTITFFKLGRSHKLFDEFISEALDWKKKKVSNSLNRMNDSNWCYIKSLTKRPIESIFIEKKKKDHLLKIINDFKNKEDWYTEHGIPYHLGILLYGPPGTGKTSIIKALSSYLNYDIYYLPVGRLYMIEKASSSLPDKCIMAIEDIDTNNVTKARKKVKEEISEDSNKAPTLTFEEDSENEILDKMDFKIGLSEILNSLDGLFSSHGRILVATTNHIESLDPALIRPGRIDAKIEVGYVNNEILKDFCSSFYPDNNINFDNIDIKREITVATLQNLVLENKSINDIISFVKG